VSRATQLIAAVAALVLFVVAATPASATDPVRDGQWQLDFLRVEDAHKYSQGDGVVVGVVDTGVDATNPDLAGSILSGAGLTAQGGDGRQDIDGHGTAMAGFIAAHGRAGGIAPMAKIVPVREFDTAFGYASGDGVTWAVDHGARVLCLAYSSPDDPADRMAVARAIAMDVVVIAPVGNTNSPSVGINPLEYPGVVGAAGVDRNGEHAAISVVTPYATLAAPAVDAVSTDTLYIPGNTGYRPWTGTSDATAIIAGAAALVRARFPKLSAVEVIHRLTATADDKGPPGRDDQYGYGVINLVKALTADVPALTPSASPEPTQALPAQPERPNHTAAVVAIGGLTVLALFGVALVVVGVRRSRRP
jgi:subtilisin family serine protease